MADLIIESDQWHIAEEQNDKDEDENTSSDTLALAYFTFDFKAYEKERGHIIDYIQHANEIIDPKIVDLLKINMGRIVDRFISTNTVPRLFKSHDSQEERHLIQFSVEVAYTGVTPLLEEAKTDFLKNPQKYLHQEGFQWQIRSGRHIHLNALQLTEQRQQQPCFGIQSHHRVDNPSKIMDKMI